MNKIIVVGIAAALGLLVTQGVVLGQTSQRWIGASGGWWDSYINWFPGNEPWSNTATQYLTNATYTINFRGDGTAMDVMAQFGDVTFDLGGHMLNLVGTDQTANPSLQSGCEPNDNARVTIRNGTVKAVNVGIADNGNTVVNRPTGYLGVIGAGARLESSGTFGIGHTGPGTMEVLGGATVQMRGGVVGWETGSSGVLRVVGTGSRFDVTFGVLAGQAGKARVLVDGAGTMSTGGIDLPLLASSNGQLAVRGAGSTFTLNHTVFSGLKVGAVGSGAIAALAGGVVTSPADTLILYGNGTMMGDSVFAANVESTGTVSPGGSYNDATDELVAAGVATLMVQGNYLQASPGVLAIDVGPGGAHDLLAVTGTAAAGGTLRLNLVNGYVPQIGDSFVVMTAAVAGGSFTTVSAAGMPTGRSFVATYRPMDVLVTVRPTPPACGADLGRQGGTAGGDGLYDNNDFVAFIDLFFAGDWRADVGRQGGVRGSDGVHTVDDFVVFINLFFTPCP